MPEPTRIRAEKRDAVLEKAGFRALCMFINYNKPVHQAALEKTLVHGIVLVLLSLGHWLSRRPMHSALAALHRTDPKQ